MLNAIKVMLALTKIIAVILASSFVFGLLLPHYGSTLEAMLSAIVIALIDGWVAIRICDKVNH